MVRRMSAGLIVLLCIVFLFPSSIEASTDAPQDRVRVIGRVLEVDVVAGFFEMETRGGALITIQVSEETRFARPGGGFQSLSDLDSGQHVLVIATEFTNGTLLATTVVKFSGGQGPPHRFAAGEITGIVGGTGSFSLRKQDGSIQRFLTDGSTRFKGKDDGLQKLEDLQVGMKALVQYVENNVDSAKAILVVAGEMDELPDIHRYGGEVISVLPDEHQFTIESDDLEVLIHTDDKTRYRSRGSRD